MNQAVTSIMTLLWRELLALCSTVSKLGKRNIIKIWVMLSILAKSKNFLTHLMITWFHST